MKAEIKTKTQKVMREVEETTETVHLELSIQEAHLVRALLGGTPGHVANEFGVKPNEHYQLWFDLRGLLGDAGPRLDVEVEL